jgi:hypothetical protein
MHRIISDPNNLLAYMQYKANEITAAKQRRVSPEVKEIWHNNMHDAAVYLCSAVVQEAFDEKGNPQIYQMVKDVDANKPPVELFEEIFGIIKDEICGLLELSEDVIRRIIRFAKDRKAETAPETIDVSPPIDQFQRLRIQRLSFPQQ